MTKTWTAIRQELSRRLNEPVMRRVGTEISLSGSIAANSFHATALANLTTNWGVAYASAYVSYTTDSGAPLGQELEIQSFRSDGSVGYAYTGGRSFSPALDASDRVEIHEFFTVQQLLDATNQAIRDAWPAFYTITKDETLIMEKFKREYDLTGLAVRPRHLIGAYIEPIFRVGIGTGNVVDTQGLTDINTSGATFVGTSTNPSTGLPEDFTPEVGQTYAIELQGNIYYSTSWAQVSQYIYTYTVDRTINPSVASGAATIYRVPHTLPTSITTLSTSNWFIPVESNAALETTKSYEMAIYYGTGAGQVRTIVAGDSGVGGWFITTPWITVPDTTSEWMVKNTSDVYYNWLGPLAKVRVDQAEDPTVAEILYDTYELWGARLRLMYAAPVPPLVGESSTLPDAMVDYVITRALYYLYMQNIGRTAQFDVKTAATLADQYDKQSEALRDRNRMKRLDSTIRTDAQYMNWSDREMPFKR
jgi:hypothetical protein